MTARFRRGPHRRWGGAFALYKHFCAAKILADTEPKRGVSERNRRVAAALSAEMAEFISAEHLKYRVPIRWNIEWEKALAPRQRTR